MAMWLFFTIHCSGVVDCKSVGVFFAYLLAYQSCTRSRRWLSSSSRGRVMICSRYVLPFLRSCKSAIAQNIFGSCSAHAGILPCSICSNFSSLLFLGRIDPLAKYILSEARLCLSFPLLSKFYLVPFLLTWGYHRKRKK